MFEAATDNTRRLEQEIEGGLRQALGYEVATFIRNDTEVATVAAYQPFTPAQLASAGALVVGFLREPPDAAIRKAVLALRTDVDDFHLNGREMYWRCAGRQSDSKLSNAVFERTLKGKATFRNFNTVTRLAARYPSSQEEGRVPGL